MSAPHPGLSMTRKSDPVSAPTCGIPVQHPWPRRILRTLQFSFTRLASRDGYTEARAAPFQLTFTGPTADCITRHIHRLGAHEPAIARYLIDHVRLDAGDIAFDVGANLGWYSVLLDRLSARGARIFAFEPDPESYRLLCRNLEANQARAVTPFNMALGDSPGTAELCRYKRSNNGRHTLLGNRAHAEIVRVPVSTLERFWDANGLGAASIRFLKIDVEGYEYFVLRGAGELLERCACVLLEYSPDGLRLAGFEPDALIELLARARLGASAFERGRLVPVRLSDLARAETQRDLLLLRDRP